MNMSFELVEDMELFDKAMDYVLKNEGGYVWDKDDLGGPTKFGITQHLLSVWRSVPASPNQVQDLTVKEAKMIYFDNFWIPLGLGLIKPFALAVCILDTSILYGPYFGVSVAQKSANTLGKVLFIDGQMGPITVQSLNDVDVKAFIETYHANLLIRINDRIEARPKNEKYRGGWTDRAKRLLTLV